MICNIPDNITSKDGLLWRDGKIIDCEEADRIAYKAGFLYAEQLVKHLAERQEKEISEQK